MMMIISVLSDIRRDKLFPPFPSATLVGGGKGKEGMVCEMTAAAAAALVIHAF